MTESQVPALTPRHVEILEGMAAGKTKQEIADDLWLSVDTVKTHLRLAYVRLGARNAPHAVMLAHAAGYIDVGCASEAVAA